MKSKRTCLVIIVGALFLLLVVSAVIYTTQIAPGETAGVRSIVDTQVARETQTIEAILTPRN